MSTMVTSEAYEAFQARLRDQIAEAFDFVWRDGLHYHPADAPRRLTRQCVLCNPGCCTRRLCIDGHEYRRRQRARRRR